MRGLRSRDGKEKTRTWRYISRGTRRRSARVNGCSAHGESRDLPLARPWPVDPSSIEVQSRPCVHRNHRLLSLLLVCISAKSYCPKYDFKLNHELRDIIEHAGSVLDSTVDRSLRGMYHRTQFSSIFSLLSSLSSTATSFYANSNESIVFHR